jgi:serine/threonine protein kinase/tetratricopeptide (TPR) repeat protein
MSSEPNDNGLGRTESFAMLARGTVISHYEIIEKVGEGGMGVVYKARDTKLGRTVALKFLPPQLICDVEAKARFEQEAKSASALSHNNITTIHDIDEVKGQCFICMEYVDGKSIKELIRDKTLSLDKVVDIAIQIGEGLSAAHKKEIVHRDVKSDNIMLTDEGVVKIMDFGLAKLKGATKLTRTGTTMGTLQYMSPEQAQGMEVDQRSDIFSFGVILYEMITGQLPFKGEHEAAVIHSIVNETPEPLARYKAKVPEGLQRIVDKALQKDASTRYQGAAEAVADLKGLQKETKVVIVAKPKSRLLPFVIPASVVFAVALLFLILKPFQVQVVPEKSAMAKENSLAIMYFDNLVDTEDEEKLGEIVTNLLITDLSESEYVNVVSSQRLYDILKLLGREGEKKIGREVATQVATKAGARWMLLGNILRVEPQTVITTQLVDVETGQVKASQRIDGETKEDVFSLVDKLTVEIKNDLSLPAAAQRESDPSVADVTTHSPEAYRYYLEGLDYASKYYSTEAERSFRKALEFDSTFAMAYLQVSMGWPGDWEEMLAKAGEYSDNVTHREKCYIKVQQAYVSDYETQYVKELKKLVKRYPEEKDASLRLGEYYHDCGEFEEAIPYLNKAIEIDPLYKLPYNVLAYTYHELGDFDKSILAMDKYISLAPDEANPYDSRAELYAWNGKLDQAIESYQKALEIKPDYEMSLAKLGHLHLFKREYAKAESCYQVIASHSDKWSRSWGRLMLAFIPAYQGKFETALKILDDGIAADRMEQTEENAAGKYYSKAHICAAQRDLRSALKEVEKGMEIYKRFYPERALYPPPIQARLLAENGDFERAQEVALALKRNIEEKDETQMDTYWQLLGNMELAKGDAKTAVTYLEKATKETMWWSFNDRFFLARAYLGSGRLGEAVAQLERGLRSYDYSRLRLPIWAVKAHYLLGLAYEKSGWNKKAIEQYEEFLEIWKDADLGIPEVEDATQRLARLKDKA